MHVNCNELLGNLMELCHHQFHLCFPCCKKSNCLLMEISIVWEPLGSKDSHTVYYCFCLLINHIYMQGCMHEGKLMATLIWCALFLVLRFVFASRKKLPIYVYVCKTKCIIKKTKKSKV